MKNNIRSNANDSAAAPVGGGKLTDDRIRNLRCGKNHAGNDHIVLGDRAATYGQCLGCGGIYTAEQIRAALGRAGEKGSMALYDARVS